MSRGNWSLADCAMQYLGVEEVPGRVANPAIMAMLQLDAKWPEGDEVPWCSGFVNWCAFNMGLERTKSLRARSWNFVGRSVPLEGATGNTVVVFSRGRWAPGKEVLKAPGHVGVYLTHDDTHVTIVGGNQSNKVSIKKYPRTRILDVRRLGRA